MEWWEIILYIIVGLVVAYIVLIGILQLMMYALFRGITSSIESALPKKEAFEYKVIPLVSPLAVPVPSPLPSTTFEHQNTPSEQDQKKIDCMMRRLFHNEECPDS